MVAKFLRQNDHAAWPGVMGYGIRDHGWQGRFGAPRDHTGADSKYLPVQSGTYDFIHRDP